MKHICACWFFLVFFSFGCAFTGTGTSQKSIEPTATAPSPEPVPEPVPEPEPEVAPEPEPEPVEVAIAQAPMSIDGRLDEPTWQRAPRYALGARRSDEVGTESGYVQFARDDDYFYVGAKFIDSDVVASGPEGAAVTTRDGDIIQVLLYPEAFGWHWQFDATAQHRKSLHFHPPQHMRLTPRERDASLVKLGIDVQGTLNAWEDLDEGWSVEIAFPLDLIAGWEERFVHAERWLVFVRRYNYSRYFDRQGPQVTVFPEGASDRIRHADRWGMLQLD